MASLGGCNAGAGSMQAKTHTHDAQGASGDAVATNDNNSNSDGSSANTTTSIGSNDSMIGSAQTGSMTQTAMNPDDSDAKVVPPGVITGAFLYCSVDSKSANAATALCALRDQKTQKPVNIPKAYKNIEWSAVSVRGITYEVKDLSADVGFWHAKFTFKSSDGKLASQVPASAYNLKVTSIATDQVLAMTTDKPDATRLFVRLQSQKTHTTGANLRCLDFYFDTDADHKGTTGPCGTGLGQKLNFNPDNTIGVYINGQNECLTYDPGNATAKYVVPKPCNATGLAHAIIKWEVNGQQIKVKGEELCLGRTPDQPDPENDYIGAQPCNATSDDQKWEILPF